MGRLFWKFFIFFWLAQVVTTSGVGIAIWIEHSHRDHPPHAAEAGAPPPPPEATTAGRPLAPPGERHHDRVRFPLLPILTGSVVSLVFAWLLAGYFSQPIRKLRTAFHGVAGGRFDTRIGLAMGRRNDELASLGTDFDRMAERLQNLIDAQRRLLHDVSHELRSPLARIQAAGDLMRQQPSRSNEFIERIERDIGRMDALVGALLTLARADSGISETHDKRIDLRALIDDIATDAEIEAEARHCDIQVECEAPVIIRGNAELLHRAIENVVRNAIQHSPANDKITLQVLADEDSATIRISDHGPGIAEKALATIFEPFVQAESGLPRTGYGLGLAISRRVIEAHGGTISAANGKAGGLTVLIRLPLLPPADASPATG